jgi:hypothetical protein
MGEVNFLTNILQTKKPNLMGSGTFMFFNFELIALFQILNGICAY